MFERLVNLLMFTNKVYQLGLSIQLHCDFIGLRVL